jgi:hypothetical protein
MNVLWTPRGESPCRTPIESGSDRITGVDYVKTCTNKAIEAGALRLSTLKHGRESER